MKVFVCFLDYDYEGYSEPLACYTDEEDAKDYIKEQKRKWGHNEALYVELELNDPENFNRI